MASPSFRFPDNRINQRFENFGGLECSTHSPGWPSQTVCQSTYRDHVLTLSKRQWKKTCNGSVTVNFFFLANRLIQ